MADVVVDLRQVHAGYGDVVVLRDVSVTVAAGEVVALLGPNGAGKTTTLRAISGLLAPTAGSIEVCGRPTAGMAPHRVALLGVGHVPEERALFADLTAEENLRLGLRGTRAERRAARSRALDLFPELGRLLADRGVQILFVPFCTDTSTGYYRVRHCAQARARVSGETKAPAISS